MRRSLLALLVVLGTTAEVRSYAGDVAPPVAPAPPSAEGAKAPDPLVLGEFALAEVPVVDGDTFRLASPKENVRVACVDTEEIFHRKEDRAAADADFAAYARAARGGSTLPVKFGTPAGEAAKAFAERLLAGVRTVRLELDEPGRDRDGYGRRLAHVLVVRDGTETLVAEALIREGLSPYFVKYGRSRRYDARLRAAQEDARKAKRGIWGTDLPHYPDYEERLVWWEERAKQVDAWYAEVAAHPDRRDLVRLGEADAAARLRERLGRTVTVFGSLDRLETGGGSRAGRPRPPEAAGTARRILLVDRPKAPFAVVVHDDEVWKAIPLDAVARRMVRATGVVVERGDRLELHLSTPENLRTD